MTEGQESQFRAWIESLSEPGWGQGTRIARITGLAQSYVSRILTGKVKGNPRAETIQQIAQHMGRDADELMIEIFQPPVLSSGRRVVPIDDRAERELLRVFRDNPGFARRTLDRYRRAKAKGLLALMERVSDALLELGPRDGYLEAGRLIERHLARAKSPRKRKRS